MFLHIPSSENNEVMWMKYREIGSEYEYVDQRQGIGTVSYTHLFILAQLKHNKMQDLIEMFDLVACECSPKSVYRLFVVYEKKM